MHFLIVKMKTAASVTHWKPMLGIRIPHPYTWYATEILHEIDFQDHNHPIIQGILKYLARGKTLRINFYKK